MLLELRSFQTLRLLLTSPRVILGELAYPPVVRKAWIKDDRLPLDINAPTRTGRIY